MEIKKTILKWKDGSYDEIYHKKGNKDFIHREDGPAIIRYHKKGYITHKSYWINCKRHRKDGPAWIDFDLDGSIRLQYYFVDGNELSKEMWDESVRNPPKSNTDKSIEPEYKKFDSGKPRTDLLGPTSILEMASVLGFGANKYSADNWKNCTEPERFLAASLRHILQYMNGEKVDSETGISHLAHAMTSLMFVRELEVLNEKK